MSRQSKRQNDETRIISFKEPVQKHATGSVIICMGNTIVNCSATIEDKVPHFLDPEKSGWLTSEYSMLPQATHSRVPREASKGKQSGRTVEIQRLIGRSLRAIIDLNKIPGKTIWIDCDVLQADGGTRTASISGAALALNIALNKLLETGAITENPLKERVAAISLGIVNGEIMLDLDYSEDSKADVDMNLIMTQSGKFVEIQMTSEGNVFSDEELDNLVALGKKGISEILQAQKEYLESLQ